MANSAATISNTINNALTGLSVTQQRLAITSRNINNLNTEGYTKKLVNQVTEQLGGVRVSQVERLVDKTLITQSRQQFSISRMHQVRANFLERLQNFLGNPQNNNTLTNSLTDFANTVANVIEKPEVLSRRKFAVDSAQKLATDFNSLSKQIQALRLDAENDIADAVKDINEQLKFINQLNIDIERSVTLQQETADLEDQRDLAIKKISEYMDVETYNRENGKIAVYTGNGLPLLDVDVRELIHDPTVANGIGQAYNPDAPVQSDTDFGGIEGIFLDGKNAESDITLSIRSGKLKGLIDLRDTILPNMAADIEKLAATFKEEMNKVHNQGTSFPPPKTLSGTRLFADPSTQSVTLSGTTRIALIDSDGKISNHIDIPGGTYTVNGIRDLINGTLNDGGTGIASTSAGGGLQLNHSSLGVAIVDIGDQTVTSGSVSKEGFSHFFGLNDLFVDGTNIAQSTTVSESMKVRPDLLTNPAYFAHGRLNDSATVTNGDQGIGLGDERNAKLMADVLDKDHSFANDFTFESTGADPFTRQLKGDLPDLKLNFARASATLISFNTTLAANAQNKANFEENYYNTLNFKSESFSGVNMDEELATIITLQQSYTASARVVTIASEMLDILVNVGRG